MSSPEFVTPPTSPPCTSVTAAHGGSQFHNGVEEHTHNGKNYSDESQANGGQINSSIKMASLVDSMMNSRRPASEPSQSQVWNSRFCIDMHSHSRNL